MKGNQSILCYIRATNLPLWQIRINKKAGLGMIEPKPAVPSEAGLVLFGHDRPIVFE
jgi:hypothetical protein